MTACDALRLLLAAGALATATGCAAPKQEVRRPFLPYQLAPQPDRRAPRPARAARTAQTLERAEPFRVDPELVRFAVEQRAARARLPQGRQMPTEVLARWKALLEQVDRFLAQPPARTVPLEVIRARVALDAELDLDGAHYASVPGPLRAAVEERAKALNTRLGQVRKLAQPARPPPPTDLGWPLMPVVVTSLFGDRSDPFTGETRFHKGVDLKARTGQLVQAAGEGLVTHAGWNGGHGLHVEVTHDDGTVTRYSHLSTVLVSTGMRVPSGGPLGLAGSTGRSTGPHLHFEIWRDGQPLDPLAELVDPALQELGTAVGAGE